MHSFGTVQIRISDSKLLGLWCIKGADESLPRVDVSVHLMQHDFLVC